MSDWIERQEGPDGQWCDLATRVGYGAQRRIEVTLALARTGTDAADAALRALVEGCSVKDVFTGELTADIDRASAEVVEPWRRRAMELYNAWYKDAHPGPKGSSRTASQTPTSGKTKPASETSD